MLTLIEALIPQDTEVNEEYPVERVCHEHEYQIRPSKCHSKSHLNFIYLGLDGRREKVSDYFFAYQGSSLLDYV